MSHQWIFTAAAALALGAAAPAPTAAPTPAAAKPTSQSTTTPATAPAAAQTTAFTKDQARDVIRTAEEIRSLEKAEIRVTLRNEGEGQKTVYDMKILRSTERRAFVDFLAPVEERGRRMLALRKNYWSTFPDSKRVVAVSRREMIGNSVFSLADLFQMDTNEDYDPTIEARETCEGKPCLRLKLTARHNDAPYARIDYWVEEKGHFPLWAKFYGVSGKLLKTMRVESRKQLGGRLRPEVIKMSDDVTVGHVSFWKTETMTGRDVPDSVFTKDYLKSQI